MFILYALFERLHSRYVRAVLSIGKLLEAESTCRFHEAYTTRRLYVIPRIFAVHFQNHVAANTTSFSWKNEFFIYLLVRLYPTIEHTEAQKKYLHVVVGGLRLGNMLI